MAFSRTLLMSGLMSVAALAVAGACTTTEAAGPSATAQAASGVYANKSVLDAAIDAAGGQDALAKVQELYWTGDAKATGADGKTVDLGVATVVRPFTNARYSSWPKADGPKKARTTQVEQGKAWDVNRVVWNPMPDAQARHENQVMGLYSFMLLAPLKSADATVSELPAGADGARAVKATYKGQTVELAFDANAKLVRASGSVTDPASGADVAQVATFSGEVVSNGVKWPQHITISQNGAAIYEVNITKFEASPTKVVRPMEQSMQYEQGKATPGEADAG